MVIFCLKHSKGSELAKQFLEDGRAILSQIPTVRDFRVLDQVSPKNDYDYGFSMVFANQADYDTYNDHPLHTDFVDNRWKVEVERFLEIDFSDRK
ncbi:Dabb family protein [Paenibacillus filicis]|uniref:Dabb family protein n=1 Tax=Paenibacillus filicis TaxID=669464 RepID=A0ABU9DN86_9BACL